MDINVNGVPKMNVMEYGFSLIQRVILLTRNKMMKKLLVNIRINQKMK